MYLFLGIGGDCTGVTASRSAGRTILGSKARFVRRLFVVAGVLFAATLVVSRGCNGNAAAMFHSLAPRFGSTFLADRSIGDVSILSRGPGRGWGHGILDRDLCLFPLPFDRSFRGRGFRPLFLFP